MSAFGQPQEPVEDLEFKDNTYLDNENSYSTGTGNTLTTGQGGGATSFMQQQQGKVTLIRYFVVLQF